jgi:bacterioferritin-associated ferredoxin
MIVCICRRISHSQIVRHAKAGMNFGDIQFELGVATQCGKCEGCAREVVAQCSANCPQANIQLADNLPGGSTWQTSLSI